MKVEELYEKDYCDNCDVYSADVFKIRTTDDTVIIRLCKKCLLQLLKAIIER